MTKKLRIAVIVSALWVAVWTFVVLEDRSYLSRPVFAESNSYGIFSDDVTVLRIQRNWAYYFGITYVPLIFAWGVWWIRNGK